MKLEMYRAKVSPWKIHQKIFNLFLKIIVYWEYIVTFTLSIILFTSSPLIPGIISISQMFSTYPSDKYFIFEINLTENFPILTTTLTITDKF